ncbi:uncharacterized protein HKW66_Vig0051160 [Vigna angularis]|uniref:Uncharacterized protein n=1 Tax=Phaseolus angularis TaxID=3914 RepID=A0A8T0L2R5_PHAAN|nr:uncharacterized protein HKW66_Vig0051160 [Vigna angularis]
MKIWKVVLGNDTLAFDGDKFSSLGLERKIDYELEMEMWRETQLKHGSSDASKATGPPRRHQLPQSPGKNSLDLPFSLFSRVGVFATFAQLSHSDGFTHITGHDALGRPPVHTILGLGLIWYQSRSSTCSASAASVDILDTLLGYFLYP